ncbi:hypothetical protein ACJMK2_028420 [Sinanodonta woodiana]|uniref:Kinesin motor domain-containing protein n=1 Tax=Sinanodonta woodiana TaxID=1069815 RepID=A0ABD3XAW2_SINWO
MPLGIDRSHFLADKVKKLEKEATTKDERIAALETENAMLYLKLAQLRSMLQSTREEVSVLQSQYETELQFKQSVAESAFKFKQELDQIRRQASSLQKVAIDLPQQFQKELTNANSVIQRQKHMFLSQSSSMSTLQDQLNHLQDTLQDITERHDKEKKRRQELHNILMELRGNIRVHCRIRPLMEFDCGSDDTVTFGRPGTKSEVVVHYVDEENICVRTTKHNKVFEYERVYSPSEGQDQVFDEVQPMLTSLLDGYNICIMAYGQTGSGKTHTMLGSHKNEDYNLTTDPHPEEGVIPRATRELFRLISEKPPDSYTLEVSVVEIYNNDIRDLLSNDSSAKHDVITGADGSLNLPTLTSKPVETVHDVMRMVQYGLRTRRETATLVHEHSSRSHLVVSLTLTSQAPDFFSLNKPPTPTQEISTGSVGGRDRKARPQSVTMSSSSLSSLVDQSTNSRESPGPGSTAAVIRTKLQLVDLAGSECVGMSGVTGAALREASHINKSLSALADVLGALAEHRSHVPYRNSRLTHLLQDSIGGDAKLLVLLCVAPAQRYITETSQCLGFGQRARQVQRGPTKRRLPSSAEKVGAESVHQRPRSGPSLGQSPR